MRQPLPLHYTPCVHTTLVSGRAMTLPTFLICFTVWARIGAALCPDAAAHHMESAVIATKSESPRQPHLVAAT